MFEGANEAWTRFAWSGYPLAMTRTTPPSASQEGAESDAATLEERLAAAEAYRREYHHRVRNNMQLIGSLLALQAEDAKDAPADLALADAALRVRAVGLAQEKSQDISDFGEMDFTDFIGTLVRQSAPDLQRRGLLVQFEGQPATLRLDRVLPTALALNELLRLAADGGEPRPLRVVLERDEGGVTLRLRGRLPYTQADFDKPAHLAQRLVPRLVQQARGSLALAGDEARLTLPDL